MKKKILVLCTGNSCRSQMAEGWLRRFGGKEFEIFSAGVETHGVNPDAVRFMSESGIDISGHTSNHLDEYADVAFDYVITVCDHAKERCPFFPSGAQTFHHNFTDPSKSTGTEEEKESLFRQVRNEIRDYAKEFIAARMAELQAEK